MLAEFVPPNLLCDFKIAKGVYGFINPYTHYLYETNPGLYKKLDGIYSDGIFCCRALSILSGKNVKRVSFDFSSIANEVFCFAIANKLKVAIIGSTPEDAKHFFKIINEKYDFRLKLAICRDGYFKDDKEYNTSLNRLIEEDIEVAIIGMGSPKQEQVLIDLKMRGWNGYGYTCGGFIRQTAKSGGTYYPPFYDKYSLRFLYRMIDEPKLIKRYFIYYPRFLARWICAYIIMQQVKRGHP